MRNRPIDLSRQEVEVLNLQALRHMPDMPNAQAVAGIPISFLSAIAVNKMINLYSSLSPGQMRKS